MKQTRPGASLPFKPEKTSRNGRSEGGAFLSGARAVLITSPLKADFLSWVVNALSGESFASRKSFLFLRQVVGEESHRM